MRVLFQVDEKPDPENMGPDVILCLASTSFLLQTDF